MRKRIRQRTRILLMCLVCALLAACAPGGQGGDQTAAGNAPETQEQPAQEDSQTPETEETAASEEEMAAPQGEELHIYCNSDVFRNRMQGYYPGYKKLNSHLGMIGETKVVWHKIAPEDGTYWEVLEEKLKAQEDDSAETEDPRIDLMVLGEGELSVFAKNGYALALEEDLGIPEEMLSDQFPYTRELASDKDGVQRAATWQAVPGVFVYRRSIAEAVFDTDDPEEVQERIADWELFAQAAPEMTAQKYFMLSGYTDAYTAFADASETSWVTDGEITVSGSLEEWLTLANDLTNHKQHNSTDLRSEEWYRDQTGEGRVFGFFTPAWSIHYTMSSMQEEDDGAYGDYAVCMGPQPYHWEGIYIAAAKGTDNKELAADVIRTMTCDPAVLKQITLELQEFTNTDSGMAELSSEEYDRNFRQGLLGGQNPMALYLEISRKLHVRPATPYDADLDAGFQVCAKNYFTGKMTRDTAVRTFLKVAVQRHPELTYEGAE